MWIVQCLWFVTDKIRDLRNSPFGSDYEQKIAELEPYIGAIGSVERRVYARDSVGPNGRSRGE